VKEPPETLKDKVEMYSGDLLELVTKLERGGFKHAYVDGGETIQSLLNFKLINEITLIQIPVLLGEGKPLFGKTNQDIRLEKPEANAFPNDFVQLHYKVSYQ
jgi:dihydrofolate reductase